MKRAVKQDTKMLTKCGSDVFWVRLPFTLMILAFAGAIYFLLAKSDKETASAGWIAAFIAIANALLLYATLRSQNEGNRIQEQKAEITRFETSFFNMLRSHRQLVDEITITRPTIKEGSLTKFRYLEFKGRRFFTFALIDIRNIQNNLKAGNIEWYKIKEAEDQENYLNARYGDMYEIKNTDLTKARKAYVNNLYHISDEDLKKKDDTNTPFLIFNRTFESSYEHYLRSLNHLLDFIITYSDDVERYSNILFFQMGIDEIKFLTWVTSNNKELKEALKKTNLYAKLFLVEPNVN